MKNHKILYTASTDIHLINFHVPYLKWFKEQGYQVHVACNGDKKIDFADEVFRLPFSRNPIHKDNYRAYQALKRVITRNDYDLIHCHTPSCGVITRLAARTSRKKGTRVLYTAHGFHFYKGSGFKNWALYFPIESLLSGITDGIITINDEDYKNLLSSKFRSKGKYHIDGIGINPERLNLDTGERITTREKLGFKENDVVFFYIAEFIPRKNHSFIFDSLKSLTKYNKDIKFMFAGGFATEKVKMEKTAESNKFADHVVFLGYQDNIGKYIAAADVGISSSKAEGLPIGISEMMFNKLPAVASDIRGHRELITPDYNGFLFGLDNHSQFEKAVLELASDRDKRRQFGANARASIEKYLIPNSLKQMAEIYNKHLPHSK